MLCYNFFLYFEKNHKEKELDKANKSTIVADYAIHGGDTGSVQVQIALLTTRINELTAQLKHITTIIPAAAAC